MSSFHKNKDKFASQIAELEKEIVGSKSWDLRGEIGGKDRPENSLLAVAADIERASKPKPVVSQEYTSTLEELIIKRIKDDRFDDVIISKKKEAYLTDKDENDPNSLSQEKSSIGLGEIYADEFLAQTMQVEKNAGKTDSAKEDLKNLFHKVCRQLDALSHFHYTPRPIVNEASITGQAGSNLSSLSFEDIAPTSESNASFNAPEEIQKKKSGRQGALMADEELTRDDKKRLRQAHKSKMRKEHENDPKTGELSAASKRGGKDANNELIRSDKRIVSGKEINEKDQFEYGKSAKFFSNLQEQAKKEIFEHNNKNEKKRKI